MIDRRWSGSESTSPLSGSATPGRSTVTICWMRGRSSATSGIAASGANSVSGTFFSSIEKSAMRHWA